MNRKAGTTLSLILGAALAGCAGAPQPRASFEEAREHASLFSDLESYAHVTALRPISHDKPYLFYITYGGQNTLCGHFKPRNSELELEESLQVVRIIQTLKEQDALHRVYVEDRAGLLPQPQLYGDLTDRAVRRQLALTGLDGARFACARFGIRADGFYSTSTARNARAYTPARVQASLQYLARLQKKALTEQVSLPIQDAANIHSILSGADYASTSASQDTLQHAQSIRHNGHSAIVAGPCHMKVVRENLGFFTQSPEANRWNIVFIVPHGTKTDVDPRTALRPYVRMLSSELYLLDRFGGEYFHLTGR
jgi:hypothetical protein